jgi:hypothetical protein
LFVLSFCNIVAPYRCLEARPACLLLLLCCSETYCFNGNYAYSNTHIYLITFYWCFVNIGTN